MIAPWRRVLGRRLGPLLLGLLLLLAQAGFLAHHLSHSLEHAHLDDPACETCLAFAPLGGTLASANLSLDVSSQPGPFEAKPLRQPLSVTGLPPYFSRAPPSSRT